MKSKDNTDSNLPKDDDNNQKKRFMNSLNNPKSAPFIAAYEVFSNMGHKDLRDRKRGIDSFEKQPASEFAFLLKDPENSSISALNTAKAAFLEISLESINSVSIQILNNMNADQERYTFIKNYFLNKIKELEINDSLIFFDDDALRIDIGYGPKEFNVFFSDFPSHFPDRSFVERNLTNAYDLLVQNEIKRLIAAADKLFNAPLPDKPDLKLEKDIDEQSLITKCFDTRKGLVIGEMHEEESPKQFLIDNMTVLKSQGVTTLYMEHLLHEKHQTLLDEYFKSPANAPMPKVLAMYLAHLDKERKLDGTATFTNMIRSAKENGIRIVAIDTEVTYAVQEDKDRMKVMNMSVIERIKQYEDNGKYVVFVGSAHVDTYKGVPGVSNLLGCSSLVVHNLNEENNVEEIEQNKKYFTQNTPVTCDILYHRSPEPKAARTYYSSPTPELLDEPVEVSSLEKPVEVLSLEEPVSVSSLEEPVEVSAVETLQKKNPSDTPTKIFSSRPAFTLFSTKTEKKLPNLEVKDDKSLDNT